MTLYKSIIGCWRFPVSLLLSLMMRMLMFSVDSRTLLSLVVEFCPFHFLGDGDTQEHSNYLLHVGRLTFFSDKAEEG